jgi:deazaflavin-dependent oxidoreductase (nitroreductase family)
MQFVAMSIVALVALVVILGTTFVVGMRRKVPFVLNAVRRSSRAMKPLILRQAGRAESPTSVVQHVGRTTGRRYETPVVATEIDGGYAIALPYGPTTDWLKNVLAAGSATLRFRGAVHDLREPRIVGIGLVEDRFAAKERRLHRRFGVRDALVLRAGDD